MKFICSSCGAEIDDSLPKCPYCDTLIATGAENEYMEKLYDIHEDLEELKEIPIETAKAEVKHQGRRIGKILIISIVIAVFLIAIFMWYEKQYERDNTADYIWGQKNFPVMSEMYENGEYDELEAFFNEAMMDDKPVWNWEYYDEFCEWMEAD